MMKISLSKVPMELLKKINATGLYGLTIEQTAEILLLDRIREFLKPGSLILELPKIMKPKRRK